MEICSSSSLEELTVYFFPAPHPVLSHPHPHVGHGERIYSKESDNTAIKAPRLAKHALLPEGWLTSTRLAEL